MSVVTVITQGGTPPSGTVFMFYDRDRTRMSGDPIGDAEAGDVELGAREEAGVGP